MGAPAGHRGQGPATAELAEPLRLLLSSRELPDAEREEAAGLVAP
ncbi:hypothetical protein [Streptomyces sp. NBC_01803]|nr:hypothetical protein [Streptomyces sp. NBC_01803]WSA45249.1 hypothetical protein OIE51_14145 [Streptomyces sp. NBC_01803]